MLMIVSEKRNHDGVEVNWRKHLYLACQQSYLITLQKNKRKLIYVSKIHLFYFKAFSLTCACSVVDFKIKRNINNYFS